MYTLIVLIVADKGMQLEIYKYLCKWHNISMNIRQIYQCSATLLLV